MQRASGICAHPYNVPGIGRNFRFPKNDVKHVDKGFQTSRDKGNQVTSDPRLAVDFCGMKFSTPLVLLSGCVGFGEEYTRVEGFSNTDAGAICLKGTTLEPRLGNPAHRVFETPAGMLNAIGLQNPGAHTVVNDILPRFFDSGTLEMAEVTPTISPSMDIQVSSNFERFLFDLYDRDGAAVTEVAVDLLTGENRILRTDILHDVGRSLNPAIDIGQIEGGFVQGAGWLTTEELVWDDAGRLRTHAPSTYKIPACADRPGIFNVALFGDGENIEDTIHKSKAVGEPPLMLAISVLMAQSHALQSIGGDYPALDAPATPERMCLAARRLGGPGAVLGNGPGEG